ncbi:Tar ligand binding domain-containing protein [Paraburkholderia sp. MM5482-R1]|uniref:Tar ligand binding domain-containing protein n=1 Tax=unclassified Paraburkholderia TaxID=2615204 RepID=UPI003D1EB139
MFDGITVKSRLTIAMAFLCLLLTGTGMLGLSSIGRVNASLKAVYETRLVSAFSVEAPAAV